MLLHGALEAGLGPSHSSPYGLSALKSPSAAIGTQGPQDMGSAGASDLPGGCGHNFYTKQMHKLGKVGPFSSQTGLVV